MIKLSKVLGFHTDIYYMLGHLGWVQFSNRVSANTHKELALEILMTMLPILDGVSSLSFRLEAVEQVVPYEYIRELLGFQKGSRNKCMCMKAYWTIFGE
jgi:hypothetical protein